MHLIKYILLPTLFLMGKSYGQVDDNTAVYRNISSSKYVRIHYDNDFFTNSDKYYSQGISIEVVNPAMSRFFISKLLVKPAGNEIKYGIALNDFGYTPTSISSNEIRFGDRPFSAALYLKTFAIATDTNKHRRISSALSVGIIGPAAGGKQMQTGIHRWLDNIIPQGWQHQIRNDVIMNYQLHYDRQLLGIKNIFLLNAAAEIQAGTLKNKLSSGLNLMIGKFNNPYKAAVKNQGLRKRVTFHLYAAPQVSFVGYDATLQGGIFNRKSPYTIASQDISKITFQANAGLVINIRKLSLEYCQSYLTKEFTTGNFHRWAGLKIGVGF